VPQVTRQHARPPDHRGRHLRRLGHRLGHDPLQRPLPQPAGEEVGDEVHLGRRGPGEEGVDELCPGAHRSGAGRACECGEGPVEFRDRDGVGDGVSGTRIRRPGPAGGDSLGDGGPAHPDPALAGFADEEADGGLDLVGGESAEQVGQGGDLGGAGRSGGHLR
jgi:hypothetical protein